MRAETAELLAELAERRLQELRTEAAALSTRLGDVHRRAELAAQREAQALAAAGGADAGRLALLGMVVEGARRRRASLAREEAEIEARLAPVLAGVRELRAEERRWQEIAARVARRAEQRRLRRMERALEDLAALRACRGRDP